MCYCQLLGLRKKNKILSLYFFKGKWLFQRKWLSSFKRQKRKRKPKLFTVSNLARFIEEGEEGQKILKVSQEDLKFSFV